MIDFELLPLSCCCSRVDPDLRVIAPAGVLKLSVFFLTFIFYYSVFVGAFFITLKNVILNFIEITSNETSHRRENIEIRLFSTSIVPYEGCEKGASFKPDDG